LWLLLFVVVVVDVVVVVVVVFIVVVFLLLLFLFFLLLLLFLFLFCALPCRPSTASDRSGQSLTGGSAGDKPGIPCMLSLFLLGDMLPKHSKA
jgi:hypothetical protein